MEAAEATLRDDPIPPFVTTTEPNTPTLQTQPHNHTDSPAALVVRHCSPLSALSHHHPLLSLSLLCCSAVARTCLLHSAGADKVRALSLLRVEVEEEVGGGGGGGGTANGTAAKTLPAVSAPFPSPSVPLRPFSLSLACRVFDWLNDIDPSAALHFSSSMHRSVFPLAAAFGGGGTVTPQEGEERGGEKEEGATAAEQQMGNDTATINGTTSH